MHRGSGESILIDLCKPVYLARVLGYLHRHASRRNDRFAPWHDPPRRAGGGRCAL